MANTNNPDMVYACIKKKNGKKIHCAYDTKTGRAYYLTNELAYTTIEILGNWELIMYLNSIREIDLDLIN